MVATTSMAIPTLMVVVAVPVAQLLKQTAVTITGMLQVMAMRPVRLALTMLFLMAPRRFSAAALLLLQARAPHHSLPPVLVAALIGQARCPEARYQPAACSQRSPPVQGKPLAA